MILNLTTIIYVLKKRLNNCDSKKKQSKQNLNWKCALALMLRDAVWRGTAIS